MSRVALYVILAWILLIFILYYRQYIEYAQFFVNNYAPHYFPNLFGGNP